MKLPEGFEPVVLPKGFEPATAVDQPDSSPVPVAGWEHFYKYAKSGKYNPAEERSGFVLGAIEAMGIDVGGVQDWTPEQYKERDALEIGSQFTPGAPRAVSPFEQISKTAFGRSMSMEDAEKELLGRMAKIYDETPLQEFNRQDVQTQQDQAAKSENKRRKFGRQTDAGLGTNEPRLNMPGVDYTQFTKDQLPLQPADQPGMADAVERERIDLLQKSNGDLFKLAQGQLTRKEEMIGQSMINAARVGNDALQDVVNAHADTLLEMDSDSWSWMRTYVMTQIPAEQANFAQRILPSATAQLSNRWKNTIYSAKTLGVDMLGLSSDAERIGRESESRFQGLELFDEAGKVLPDHEEKLREIIRKEVDANRIEGGLDKASRQKIEDYYFQNFSTVISPAMRQAKLDRLKYGAKALADPQYNQLDGWQELTLSAIGTTVDMAALALVSRIPVVGFGLTVASTYGSFQGDLEQRLVYQNDMPLSQARLLSGIAAVPYAMTEYSQAFHLGKAPSLLPFIGEKNAPRIFMQAFGNYYRRAVWPELREEYIQAGIEFAAMETARVFCDSKGITFDQNIKSAVNDAVQATFIMPFVTGFGGFGVSAGKAIGDGSLRSFIPEELRQAVRDVRSPVDVYESAQKARRAVRAMDELGTRPNQYPAKLTEAVRLLEQQGEGTKPGQSVITPKQNPDGTWVDVAENSEAQLMKTLAEEGYEDPANALDGIRAQIQLEDAVQERIQAGVKQYQDQLSAQLDQNDDTDVSVGPKMGLVQGAMQTYGDALGVNTEVYSTQEEALAAHPELKVANGEKIKAVNLDGRRIVMVEENLTDSKDAMSQWWHEAGGHRGLDINPKAQRFLDGVKDELGIDFIKSQIPAFYHNQSDAEMVGEYLSRLVGRAGQSGELGATEQEKGVWQRFKDWAGTELGLDMQENVAARSVARTAKDILAYAKGFDGRYPDGMTVKLERKAYTRQGGQWVNEKGRAVKDAGLVETIQAEADAAAQKTEDRRRKAAKVEADKRIQAMADSDPIIKMVLEEGGVQMPEMKPGQPLPDEYAAIPQRFRGKKGAGLALDELADQVAALSGQTADYSTDELRAYLEAFETKAEKIINQQSSAGNSSEEQLLADQLERGEISESEFHAAMNELTRFSVEEMAQIGPDKFNELLADPRYSIAWASDRWQDAVRNSIAFEDKRVRVYNVDREGDALYETQIKKSGKWATVQYADNLDEAKNPEPQVTGFINTLADYIQAKKTLGKEWYGSQVAAGLSDNDIFGLVDGIDPASVRINFIPPPTYGDTPTRGVQRDGKIIDISEGRSSSHLLAAEGDVRFSVTREQYSALSPIKLTGNEIGEFSNTGKKFSELFATVEQWGTENGLFGAHPTPALGHDVTISRNHLRGSLSKGGAVNKFQMVAALSELLQHAILLEEMPNYKNPTTTDYILAAKADVAGVVYTVGLVVQKNSGGRYFYNHEMAVEEKDGQSPPDLPRISTRNLTAEGRPEVNKILQKHLGVNRDNTIRFSVEQAEDPYQATAVHIAYRIFNGDFQVKRIAKGKNKGQMVARTEEEQAAEVSALLKSQGLSPSKPAVQQVLEDARAVAQQAIVRKQSLKTNQSVSKFIRDESTRQWFNRQVEGIYREGQTGGALAQQAFDEIRRQQERAMQTLLTTRPGMGTDELREYNLDVRRLLDKLELEETKRTVKPKPLTDQEFEQAVDAGTLPDFGVDGSTGTIYKAEVDDFLFRMKTAVVRKLTKEGVLDPKKDLLKSMRSPVAVAEYRKTLQNVLGHTASELSYGFRRDVLERKIRGLDDAKLMSTLDSKAGTMLQQMFDARDQETLDTQVEKVFELTKQFAGRLKYRLAETSQAVQVRALKMFRQIRGEASGKSGVLLMEPDAVQEEMEQLRKAFDEPERYAPDGADVAEWVQDAIDRYNMLDRFGAFKYKKAAERADAVGWLETRIETELKEQEERRAAVKAEAEEIQKALDAALPRRKTAGHNVRSVAERFADSNSQVLFLEQRLLEIPMFGKDADRKKAEKMMKALAFDLAAANFHKNNKVAEDNRAFGQSIEQIYGVRFAENELKALMKPLDAFRKFSMDGQALSRAQVLQMLGMLAQEDIRSRAGILREIEQKLETGNVKLEGKAEDIAQSLWQTPDEFIKYRTSKGVELNSYELLQAVRGVQDGSKLARRLELEPAMIQALRETSPADFELLDWFRKYYFNNRAALSEVNKQVTGFVIQPPDALYIPSKVDFRRSPIKSVNISMPVVPPSLTPRVFNTRDLSESADIISIYMSRLESNEHFINFAKLHQRVAGIFGDPELTRSLELTHGKRFSDQLGVHLRDVLSGQPITGGKMEVIDGLVNFFAVTRLGWNLSLFPKQLTSLPSFAMYVDSQAFFSHIGSAFSPEGIAAMKEILASPHAKTRMRTGQTQVDRDILSGMNENGMTVWEFYKRFGRYPTMAGDIGPTLVFGQGYYRAMLDDAAKQGMRTDEGKEWAMDQLWRLVEMSQQSGSLINMAEWQRHGGSAGRALGQFISTPSQFWAKQVFDWRDWRAAIEAEGNGSDRAKAAAAQLAKTTLINHILLPGLYNGVRILWNGMLGEPPDKKDALALLSSVLVGPFAGIVVLGSVVEGIASGLITGQVRFGGDDMIPISGIASDAQTLAAAMNELFNGDFDATLKDLNRILKGMAPPYRDASKAWKNYSE